MSSPGMPRAMTSWYQFQQPASWTARSHGEDPLEPVWLNRPCVTMSAVCFDATLARLLSTCRLPRPAFCRAVAISDRACAWAADALNAAIGGVVVVGGDEGGAVEVGGGAVVVGGGVGATGLTPVVGPVDGGGVGAPIWPPVVGEVWGGVESEPPAVDVGADGCVPGVDADEGAAVPSAAVGFDVVLEPEFAPEAGDPGAEVDGDPDGPDVGADELPGEVALGVSGPMREPRPSTRVEPAPAGLNRCGASSAIAATAAVVTPPIAIGAGRKGLNGLRLER
jgi:hypothetical protein